MHEAERPARLTIGPWTHAEFTNVGVLEAIEFGLAHARGEEPAERAPVRLFVMDEDAWRDFDSWPPKESAPDTYRYDPAGPGNA